VASCSERRQTRGARAAQRQPETRGVRGDIGWAMQRRATDSDAIVTPEESAAKACGDKKKGGAWALGRPGQGGVSNTS